MPGNEPIEVDLTAVSQIDSDELKGEELRHSRRLDVHRWSDHAEVNVFVDHIYERFFVGGNAGIRKRHIKVILLDLYVAWCDDPTLKVSFSRSPNEYLAGSIYNELHISRLSIPTIDRLVEVGLIEQAIGFFNKEIQRGFDSRMWPTKTLVEMFAEVRFSPLDVGNSEKRLSVILKNADGRKEEYDQSDETLRMCNMLAEYNELLNQTYISIPHLEDMRVPYSDSDQENSRYLQVSQNNKFVRRIFNRSSFDTGGRFYGGWWQRCPQRWRRHILINDHVTNEIDFSGFHPVMLYALEGINYWRDIGEDPYDIGRLSFLNDENRSRSLAKNLMLILINATSLKSSFSAFRQNASAGSPEKKFTNEQLQEVVDALKEKHKPIADNLYSDLGIHLQYLDSRITERILETFTEIGEPVLAIHDSYIVRNDVSVRCAPPNGADFDGLVSDLLPENWSI